MSKYRRILGASFGLGELDPAGTNLEWTPTGRASSDLHLHSISLNLVETIRSNSTHIGC